MTQIGNGNDCWSSPFETLCLQDAVKKCTRCPTKVTTEMLSTKGSEMLKNTTSETFFTLFFTALPSMNCSGLKEKVEGNYEQPSQGASDDWHFVTITAKPGSDMVFQ